MKKIIITLLLLCGVAYGQIYQVLPQRYEFKDSVKLFKLKNNPGGDSILATDQSGRLIQILKPTGGGSTDTANLSYRIDTTSKWVYGDWWITPITINDSTVQFTFNQNALDSAIAAGGGGLIQSYTRLIRDNGYSLSDTILTLNANIVWQINSTIDSTVSNQVYTINTLPPDYKRYDVIWIDSTGNFNKTVGTADTIQAVLPFIDYNGITVTTVLIHADTLTPVVVSTLANNSILYQADGQIKSDAVNLGYNPVTRNVNLGGSIVMPPNKGLYFADGNQGVTGIPETGLVVRDYLGRINFQSIYPSVNNYGYFDKNSEVGYINLGKFGIGTASPNSSAALDVSSTTKSFLPPRMTGAQMAAIVSPAAGSTIYNTDSTALCFYNGSNWNKIGVSSGGGMVETDPLSWHKLGNAGTDSSVNFIGTTDAQPLYIRVNDDTTAKFGTLYNFQSGKDAYANGHASVALGDGVFASGDYSFASGRGNYAEGNTSIAMGISTTASGFASIAIGNSGTASGESSIMLGNGNASGVESLVLGNGASSGEFSVAIRGNATAIGSIAIGNSATANGEYSTALGQNTIANNNLSTALGWGASTVYDSSTVVGSSVTVRNNGNVGIGTTTPTEKLDVAGGVKCDSMKIGDSWFYTKKIILTPSQINSLSSTVVSAIPDPGAGKIIEVISATAFLDYNSVIYVNAIVLSLTTISNTTIASTLAGITIEADKAVYNFIPNNYQRIQGPDNGVYITADSDNDEGNSNIIVSIYYRIITI